MDQLKVTIGFSPLSVPAAEKPDAIPAFFKVLEPYRHYIHDLHFPHYNPHICSSGRAVDPKVPPYEVRLRTLRMIEWNRENAKFPLTLLLNYLLHDNYKVVVDNFKEEFYSRGIRSVAVADLELIKRLKDRLPDLNIQGSCLSHRMTEEELAEEQREGVTLHNPSVNIIRNSRQLMQNAKAGFAQKVIAFEGCLNHCSDEVSPYGHRWYIARSLPHATTFCARKKIATDPRYFFKANWVTVQRFKELKPFIAVVKLPRIFTSGPHMLATFFQAYEHNVPYNVLDFNGAGYQRALVRDVGYIPSNLFDSTFFNTLESCSMDCEKRKCTLCFEKIQQIKLMSYKQKRLAGRSHNKRHDSGWLTDIRYPFSGDENETTSDCDRF